MRGMYGLHDRPERRLNASDKFDFGDNVTVDVDAKTLHKHLQRNRQRRKHIIKTTHGCMFTHVFACSDNKNRKFGVKQIHTTTPKAADGVVPKFHKEIQISQKLADPTMVRFYTAVQYDTSFFLVIELCSMSVERIYKLVKQNNVACTYPGNEESRKEYVDEFIAPEILYRLFGCVVHGLHYLHKSLDKTYYHGDVRPANMMYHSKGEVFKLSDFSVTSSKMTEELTGARRKGQVKLYVPPELTRQDHDAKVGSQYDIWCLGVTLNEVATLQYAYGRIYHVDNNEPLSNEVKPLQIIEWMRKKETNGLDDKSIIPFPKGHPYSEEFMNIYERMTCGETTYRYGYDIEHEKNKGTYQLDHGLIQTPLFTKYYDEFEGSPEQEEFSKYMKLILESAMPKQESTSRAPTTSSVQSSSTQMATD